MRADGTCGNGMNVENHNKKCLGSANCKAAFTYGVAKKSDHVSTRADYKTLVSAQYKTVCEKTGEFFREVVKFGALLNEVEGFIGNEQKRGGSGLKGWLEENCPEINYFTAQGYKAMASKCAKMIGGGVQALACLQGRDEVVEPASQETIDIEASFIEKRDALFEEVDSRRKLEQMWFEFCGAKPKSNRGILPGQKADLKAAVTDTATAARAVWSKVIATANQTMPALKAGAELLNVNDVKDALATLDTLKEILNARWDDLKKGNRW